MQQQPLNFPYETVITLLECLENGFLDLTDFDILEWLWKFIQIPVLH